MGNTKIIFNQFEPLTLARLTKQTPSGLKYYYYYDFLSLTLIPQHLYALSQTYISNNSSDPKTIQKDHEKGEFSIPLPPHPRITEQQANLLFPPTVGQIT